jgi:DNA-binding transcriptional ArsR family regulator
MSETLDRIRHELQQRLESTRAAAQEHERVRTALEALENATKQVTHEASKRGRSLASRARPSSGGSATVAATPAARRSHASARSGKGGSTAESGTKAPAPKRRTSASGRAGTGSRKSGARSGAGRETSPSPSTPKARTGKPNTRGRAATTGTPSPEPTRAQAPRGANRAAVLAVVRERPGVTAGELAAASGVSGGTLSALLRRLTEAGVLEKRELPDGQTGYAVPAEATGVTPAVHATPVSPADGGPAAGLASRAREDRGDGMGLCAVGTHYPNFDEWLKVGPGQVDYMLCAQSTGDNRGALEPTRRRRVRQLRPAHRDVAG